MGKMKELEDKLKELKKLKLMNKLPTPGKTALITWIAVGRVYSYSGQGGGK